MTHSRKVGLLLCGLAFAASHVALAAADPSVPLYTAVYNAEYDGKDVGTAEFSVSYDAKRDIYTFMSRTMAKGFLKLARPNPVVERSEFRLEAGRIRPVEFWYEDGSRKGEDNLNIAFDWERHVIVVSGKGARREVALTAGALDRGSLQVALMRDLITTGQPGRYLLADEDGTTPYEYTDNGDATTATGLGQLPTRALMRQRAGSARSTWVWLAPKLSYLPARIEQRRNGEVSSAFTLSSVQGLATR